VAQTTPNTTKTKEGDDLYPRQKGREHYKIVADILKAVQSGPQIYYNGERKSLCKLYHITCGASIPWSNVRKYLELMTVQNLLISSYVGEDMCYEISDKGLRYLQLFEEMEDDLRPI
jgi:predicted transcriptional regulator